MTCLAGIRGEEEGRVEGGDEVLDTSADVVTVVSGRGVVLRGWRYRSGVRCGEVSGRVV